MAASMYYIVVHTFALERRRMPTTTFTTRIDADLKARLEEIAKQEDRSTSYMANQAIRSLVEEREATARLAVFATKHLEDLERFDEADVDAWLDSPDDAAFPEPKT